MLLAVRHLKVRLRVGGLLRARELRALDGMHFDLRGGESLAIIDESGVSADALAQVLCGEVALAAGSVSVNGRELAGLKPAQLRALRLPIQRILPAPPRKSRKKAGDCLAESLKQMNTDAGRHGVGDPAHWLEKAGLPAELAQAPLRELSAAQCWHMGLARALAMQPQLLICDLDALLRVEPEPATTLDLLARLQQAEGLALLWLAREPGMVPLLAQRVLVMYYGRVMEQGSVSTVFGDPRHPYTRALLAIHRGEDVDGELRIEKLREGPAPDLGAELFGCRFAARCPMADALCMRDAPQMRTLRQGSGVACHYIADTWQPPRRAA